MPHDAGARGRARDLLPARVGATALLVGLAVAFAVQVANPVGVPLYDGVIVQEPYRFLHPSGDEAGDPASFRATIPVAGSASPPVQAFTAEQPAQIQLIAQRNAFVLTPDATALEVSIEPVEAPAVAPSSGEIAGNVYRVAVTDQAGAPLQIRPCEGCILLVLRAPQGVEGAVLHRFADGAWIAVETIHAGMVALYSTNPTQLGDYAVVADGSDQGEPGGEGGLSTGLVVAGGALVILLLALAGYVALRAQRARTVEPEAPGPAITRPSKRRRPRRPPDGRSDR